MWANLVDGVRYVRAERSIALLVLLAAIPALFILNYLVLMPVFARDVLRIGAPGLGLLNASLGVGALSGALIVAIVIARLPIGRASNDARVEASMWANVLDGIRYIRAERTIALLVLLAAIPALFILNYLVLMPVFARDVLKIGAPGLGLLNASLGVGALSGALLVAVLRPGGGSGRLMLAGLASASIGLIVFGLSTWLPLSCIALAALGGSQVAYYATTNTLIQVLVSPRLRGRVLSLYVMTSLGLIPFGNLMAGAIAEQFGAPLALAGGGTVTLILLAIVAIAFPALRRVTPVQAARNRG